MKKIIDSFDFSKRFWKLIEESYQGSEFFSSINSRLIWAGAFSIYFFISILFLDLFHFDEINNPLLFFVILFTVVYASSLLSLTIFRVIDKYFVVNLSRTLNYIIIACLHVLLISTLIYICEELKLLENSINESFSTILQEVLIIMILPIIIFILSIENYLIKKRLNTPFENINSEIEKKNEEIITIKSDNIKESLKINIHDFICAEANDNYSCIYFNHSDKVSKVLLRLTLKNLENQFKNYSFINRCHKSYVININQIENIVGSSQNHKIIMNGIDIQIPASRNFPKNIIDLFKEQEIY